MSEPCENVECALNADGRIAFRLPPDLTIDKVQAERLMLKLAKTVAAAQPPLTPGRAAELLCLCRRMFVHGLAR